MSSTQNTKLFGFEDLEKSILSDFDKNKLHHSLLITGEKGTGKATFAYIIANKILATKQNSDINNSYSFSTQTRKLINAKSHPDFLVIEKQINERTKKLEKEIKVASIREINEFINLTPSLSDYKVIIIDSADDMNVNAQNVILKTLEEPNDNSFIILVSHNSHKLLDTIKSRCREIEVKALKYEDWKKAILNCFDNENTLGLDDEELKTLSTISNNSVSFALNIINLDGLEFYEQILHIFSKNKLDIDELQTFTGNLKSNDELFQLFKFFITFFFERLVKLMLNQEISTFISENEQKAMEIIANKNEIDSIFGKFEYSKQLLFDIERRNLDKKHCLGVLFSKIV